MKVPIPNDWDGNEWECVQILWPNSPQFWGLLNGLLTLMTRGRYWEENTGSIIDMQAIAWEIFDRNFPFTNCNDEPVPPPEKEIIYKIMSSLDGLDLGEDEQMSLCGYNPNAFKIEGGILYVRDFCGDWVAIGALGGTSVQPPPDIYDDYDPQPTPYQCGKASYLVDQFAALSDAAWASYTNPIIYETVCRAAVDGSVNLDRAYLWSMAGTLGVLDIGGYDGDYFTETQNMQNAKCLSVGSMNEDLQATDIEVGAVVNALASVCSQDQGVLSAVGWLAYWTLIRDVFGSLDCRKLIQVGATISDADCACVDSGLGGPTVPTASGWYWSAEQEHINYIAPEDGEDMFGYGRFEIVADHDMYGMQFRCAKLAGDNVQKMGRNAQSEQPFDVNWFNANSDSFSLGHLYVQVATGPFAELYPSPPSDVHNVVDGGGNFSNIVGSPTVEQGERVKGRIICRVEEGSASFVITDLRYLHNENSASHG